MKKRKPGDADVVILPDGKKITWTPTHKPGDGGVVVLPDGNIGIVIPEQEVQEAVEGEVRKGGEFAVMYMQALEADRVRLRRKQSVQIKEGLAKAREKGVTLGRPPGSSVGSLVLRGEKRDEALRRLTRGGPRDTYRHIADDLRVNHSAVYRLAKQAGISRRKRNSP